MTVDEAGHRGPSEKDEREALLPLPLIDAQPARRSVFADGRPAEPWLQLGTVVSAALTLVALAIGWPLVLAAIIAALVHMRHGPAAVFQSLAAIVVIKFLNDAIYDFPPMFGLLAWAALLLAAVRSIGWLKAPALKVLIPLWVFVLVVAALTPIASADPTVSWFKLLSFLIGATSVIVIALAMPAVKARLLGAWLPSVVLAVALVSVLTFPFPAVSYRTAPNLFQGVMNHSQALAAVLAPLLALLSSRWLFHRKSFRKAEAAALLVTAALVIATNARTAVIAVALGIGSTMLLGLFRDRRNRSQSVGALAVATIVGALAIAVIMTNGAVRSAVVDFAFKGSHESTVEDAFMASRGVGIEGQWQNFLESPLIGNGFGVYPEGWTISKPVTVFGLPISAPVEKGFLPTAVLEEVGIVGAMVFLALLVALVRRVLSTGNLVWTAVLMTCLFVNIGEAVFFSIGGLGLYLWLWIGLAMRGSHSPPQVGGPEQRYAAPKFGNLLS